MKNVIKSIVFLLILFILVEALALAFLPKSDIRKYGLYNTSAYEILHEKERSIDVIFLGDSLTYSSINPMQIWHDTGISTYNVSEPAHIIKDAYRSLSVAVTSQKPKYVFMEGNILFRDARKYPLYQRIALKIQNYVPIYKYHNNWKKMLSSSENDWLNSNKGYKFIEKIVPGKDKDYMKFSDKLREIPNNNTDYFEDIVKLCQDNNVELVLFSTPSQVSYNYPRRNTLSSLSVKYGIKYIDLNLNNPLDIDWKRETKDKGDHLNYIGAKKTTSFWSEYLKSLGTLKDHRDEEEYKSWHDAYKIYESNNLK